MSDSEARLDAIRREIDALDTELLDLLNRRARTIFRVAAVKEAQTEPRYYRPDREAALLRRIVAANPGPLPDREAARLFREIVSSCRTLEQRLVVGCTTVEEGCAAIGHFGGAVDLRPVADAAQALDVVADAGCDYAMLEFSRAGFASPVIADLRRRGLRLCGEWYARDSGRFVAIGHEPVAPTGHDLTSFIVPAGELATVESWCRDSNLDLRSVPVAGAAPSAVVDVSAHESDPRLAPLVERYPNGGLGAYPVAVAVAGGEAGETGEAGDTGETGGVGEVTPAESGAR